MDRRLTWREYIITKRNELNIKLRNLYWLMRRELSLPLHNKTLAYKMILKLIWTYSLELWGTAATNNMEVIQHFQTNDKIHKYLEINIIRTEYQKLGANYERRLHNHSYNIAIAKYVD